MEVQNLTVWDWVLTPFYLLVLVLLARRIRNRNYPIGHPLRQYYLAGFYAKLGGAIFIGLVYHFYYNGGDTFNYFNHARIINSSLSDSWSTWFKLITHASPIQNPEVYPYSSQLYWYDAPSEYTVAVITAIFSLFTGTTYLPTALIFAFVSFSGIWAMYRTFVQLYPRLKHALALTFLFIPSTVIWGSGIFKDTICMFGLGWMTYATFRLFVNRDFSVRNSVLIVLSFYLIAVIKLYILLAYLPALALWLLLTYSKKIKAASVRWAVNGILILATMGGTAFFMQQFADELKKYSLEQLLTTAETTRSWTNYAAGDEGSVYNIGQIDGSLGSTLALFPQAVVVTLFRPFLWEARKLIVALSAIEALAFLYLTLRVFLDRKAKPLRTVIRDPNVLFCLVFSLVFSFAVGASSGNFGALSRYKIPCLPFYAAFLAVMLGKEDPEKKTKGASVTLVAQHVV